VIAVVDHDSCVEVECGHCGTLETADCHTTIVGFVLTADGASGIHCCWCARDADVLPGVDT
jgi:hypothetical protein